MPYFTRRSLAVAPLLVALAACTAEETDATTSEDDLTSVTARSRELRFESVVYVPKGSSDAAIVTAAQAQTKTAFGALQHAEIAVNDRELRTIDPKSFKKRDVKVVDSAIAGDAGRDMTEVRYTYVDNAVVPVAMARRTTIASAVLNQGTYYQGSKVVVECTANTDHSRDYPNWYEFDPTTTTCRNAIKAEQTSIDAAYTKLGIKPADAIVPKAAVDRVYFPITVKLGADKTNKGLSYPEYDRLFTGGVQKDKLVLGLMYGLIDDNPAAPNEDYNFREWLTHLDYIFKARPGFTLVKTEPSVDFSKVTLTSGKVVDGITVPKLVDWGLRGQNFPAGLNYADQQDLLKKVALKLYKTFITLEAPVKVKVGATAERTFGIQVLTYFGVESDSATHKKAIKNSDVYFYNGHSYIGSGPLDPKNFTAADFPKTYQLLFIDGCVSYNYYEKDYFPLKEGGTKNLELVTNGLEAPSYQSGTALGKFTAGLIDGTFPSYSKLLGLAAATDPLRVVDGEIDNTFNPKTTTITIK